MVQLLPVSVMQSPGVMLEAGIKCVGVCVCVCEPKCVHWVLHRRSTCLPSIFAFSRFN